MGRNAKLRTARRLSRIGTSCVAEVESQSAKPFNFFTEAEQVLMAIHQYPYPTYPYEGAVWHGWMEAAVELMALDDREHQGWMITYWQRAQQNLLRGCLTMAGGTDITAEGLELIKKAGQVLGDIGGTREMNHTATMWVPNRLLRLVDISWNGIHGWRS